MCIYPRSITHPLLNHYTTRTRPIHQLLYQLIHYSRFNSNQQYISKLTSAITHRTASGIRMSFFTATHSPTPTTRSSILKPFNTMLFVCDIQETFRGKIYNWPDIVSIGSSLTNVGKILDMQIIITEQNPFKDTIHEIDTVSHSDKMLVYKKTKFSMITNELQSRLSRDYVHENIIIYGIETHVCILQTCVDLIRMKYNVYVVVDGVGSQRKQDHKIAIQRLIQGMYIYMYI